MLQGIDNKKKLEQKSLRPYRKPHLHAYGTVKDLTAGGTGKKPENQAHLEIERQRL